MKLATVFNGRPDGELVVLSSDGQHCVSAGAQAPDLQSALNDWSRCEPALRALAQALDRGDCPGARPFDPQAALSPLPRAWQ